MIRTSRAILAVILAVLMGMLLPVQVFADTPDYISEVKVFAGDYSSAESEGYTLLKEGKKPVDLNRDAGAKGKGAKGDKAVYLGYKTTKKRSEAITDLALMNMKGGYSVKDYEALMELQMKSQILPFVENFVTALEEYRANYASNNIANKQRAKYLYEVLNKLTDDDTGMPLGELLLEKTKYELGDEAYNALSAEEKKKHADIVTILAQANGRATLLLENLITRAADTSNNTWLDRFAETTYDDLVEATGKAPYDAEKQIAKLYYNGAVTILDMWDVFQEELLGYDAAVAIVENYDENAVNEATDALNSINDNTGETKKEKLLDDAQDACKQFTDYANARQIVEIHDRLSEMDYLDGTMLDFFLQDSSDLEENVTLLYPMVAALSQGQLTGLDFVSLKELVRIAINNEEGYSDEALDELEKASIYEGVDRAIYDKGGVALTSDALRKESAAFQEPPSDGNSQLLNIMLFVTLGLGAATLVSGIIAIKLYMVAMKADIVYANRTYAVFDAAVSAAWRTSRIANYMTIGIGIAAGIMMLVAYALNQKEMAERYKVEFTPIPHYMVDEKDVICYNSKGEKIVVKNQTAYYKAVQCNRNSTDEKYASIGTCADMNGDVGSQWLALYATKNEAMQPILASSLKTVTGSENIPAGYTTGIHMFGSDAAFNLNNKLYDWNNDAPSIFVYFKTDDSAASPTGANFTAGKLTLFGGAGLVLGAGVTVLARKTKRKKNDNQTVAV